MLRIFINYRRQDSEGYAGRLFDHLLHHLEREQVFIDVDDIPAGADFVDALEKAVATCDVLLAVGAPDTKRKLVDLLRPRGALFATLIHPTAIIGSNCRHDEGVIICPLAMNTANTHMGSFSTLLTFSGLGHDARLGAFSTVSSHVDLMGHATVGEGVFIGSGARVMPGVTVGDGARIGANVVAQRNVAAGMTLFTLPAKSLKMPDSNC